MATQTNTLERIYTIPLRRKTLGVPQYKRARKAVLTVKQFIAKHMKVENRDISKVRVDVAFNNEIWFRGARNAPSKVKVKATKEGDIVRVTFAEMPQHVKYAQAKLERRNQAKAAPAAPEVKTEAKTQTAEEKKEEKEKEVSTAVVKEKEIKQDNKAMKHTPKADKMQRPTKAATGR